MKKIESITRANYFKHLDAQRSAYHDEYYTMYSSLLDGITNDPMLMQVPVDDHLVHRGDGIFETFKCVGGAIYNLNGHLERFERSADMLSLQMRWSQTEIRELVIETVRRSEHKDCSIRLMLSRGPGSFSVNPYDCNGPQLFIIVSKLKPSFIEEHPGGATLGISKVSAKLSFFARVKNCNYLPNVLMRKEAADTGVDFVVGFDSRNMMTEGSTENVGIITRKNELAFPSLDGILCGTTMMRIADLARENSAGLGISAVNFRDIPAAELDDAAEIIIVGTTPNVTAVRKFNGKPTPRPVPGRIASALNRMLLHDIHHNTRMRTIV